MKFIKKAGAIALTIATAFSLVACNNSGGSNNGKVKIRFATWDNAQDLTDQQERVDRFNKENDKIEVSLEAYGDNYDTKVTAAMGGKDAPDVMYMWNYPKYSKALLSLNDLIEKEGKEYKDNFYETLWNYNKIGDDVYGIPVGFTTHVMYYNKDLFEKAGVEMPTGDWTWDDAKAAAEKISALDDSTFGLAVPIKPDPYDYEMFAWSNGGAFSDENGNMKDVINSEATAKPFAFFQEMIMDGTAVATNDYGEDNFKLGKIGMYMNGAWSVDALNASGINYGIALLPNFGDQKSQSIVSSSGLGISKDSKNAEAAWEFIKYWTSEELNKERIGFELPVLKSVVESEGLEKSEATVKFYEMLERSAEHMPASFIATDQWSNVSDDIQLALEQILNKNSAVDAKTAFDEVAGKAER